MIEKCYVIPIQKECNSDCVFCISKVRNYNNDIPVLKCDEKFIENIFLMKRRGIKKFEITGGGEPFLNNDLELIASTIKKIIPDSYIKLYTNGNILKKIDGIDEFNVSVTHYDTLINNKFMKSLNPIDLEKKLKFFKENHINSKIRLSIPLIKGAIDNKEKLDNMISITEKYVDEYVVRTLYPHTPKSEELYVDFDYENNRVIFERENEVSEFDGIIMWSDGELYTNWEINEKRWLYSYLLLKPDSRTYINEIEKLINENNFKIVSKKFIDDFVDSALSLYQEKEKEYLVFIKKHLESSAFLFGNQGLLLILDKDCNQNELLMETDLLKKEIRKLYSLTHFKKSYISIDDKLYHLNLVHCPDPELEPFNRDINNFVDRKEINEKEFQLIKKYRSYNI